MSLFLDIGTGAGLAGATGVRPFLPPLLTGALARGDVAIDFDGTDWSFLESPGFLFVLLGLALILYGLERTPPADGRLSPGTTLGLAAAMVLGGMMFAGSLADGGHPVWIGLVAGPLCAALGWLAVNGLLARARRRLDEGAGRLIAVYADAAALLLAAVAIFLPPAAFLALAGFAALLVGGRRRDDEKYAGLRILR